MEKKECCTTTILNLKEDLKLAKRLSPFLNKFIKVVDDWNKDYGIAPESIGYICRMAHPYTKEMEEIQGILEKLGWDE